MRVLVVLGLAVMAPATVWAQEAPTPPMTAEGQAAIGYAISESIKSRVISARPSSLDVLEVGTRRLTGQRGVLAGESQERIDRATRLAAMANSGDCPGAIRMAQADGDVEMATRLFNACRAPAS